LPGVAKLRAGELAYCLVKINVGEQEHRGVATKLKRGALQVVRGEPGELASDLYRARKAQLTDDWRAEQLSRHLGWYAIE
jgi:hypothetical protein